MKKRYTLYYYEDGDGFWHWHLLSPGKKFLFQSSEKYASKTSLLIAIKKTKALNFDYILVRTKGTEEVKTDFILK